MLGIDEEEKLNDNTQDDQPEEEELEDIGDEEEFGLDSILDSCEQITLNIGDELTEDHIRLNCKYLVLGGKARVLKTLNTDQEVTVLILNQGDLFDYPVSSFSFVASQETVLCVIPEDIVLDNSTLAEAYEKTSCQFEHILSSNNGAVSINSISQAQEKEVFLEEDAISSTDIDKIKKANYCLKQALLYYKKSVYNNKEEKIQVQNLNELEKKLKGLRFETKRKKHTIVELLNKTYPFILKDDQDVLRWVVGRKGNSLIEEYQGSRERFTTDLKNIHKKYEVLSVKPRYKKAKKILGEPFTYSWYISLYSKNAILTIQMMLASVITQIFTMGMPFFYMVIFDRVFGRQNLSALNIIGVGIVLILLTDLFVKTIRSYILSHLLESIDKLSIDILLERIFSIDFANANKEVLQNYAERFKDLIKINQEITTTFLISSLDVAFSSIVVIILLLLNVKMALISLAPIVPITIMIFWTNPIVKKRAVKFSSEHKSDLVRINEILNNQETIQSINANTFIVESVTKKVRQTLEKNFLARYDQVNGNVGLTFISTAGSMVTLYFGAQEALAGTLSFGVYLAISMLGRSIIGTIQKMLVSLQKFQEAAVSLKEFKKLYYEDTNFKEEDKVFLNTTKGHIRFVDVDFKYQENMPNILNCLNFEIQPGEKVILTGKSGTGKSTIFRLMQRLYNVNSGYVALDDFNIVNINEVSLRNSIGLVLQKPGIFTGSIKENLILGNPYASMKNVIEVTTMVGLDTFLSKLPQGMDSPVLANGSNLSGGQIAQIALARVLLTNPEILIIDETLNSLDFSLQGIIFNRIFEKFKNSTCIFVTDYLPVHMRADKVIVLQEGKILEQGKYDDLLKSESYYFHLHPKELIAR